MNNNWILTIATLLMRYKINCSKSISDPADSKDNETMETLVTNDQEGDKHIC